MSTSADSIIIEQSLHSEDDQETISAEEYMRREKAIKGTDERFLNGDNTDEEGWRSEALAVIDDIHTFVNLMSISSTLPCDNNGIYMNLETKESIRLTIELSSAGFRICGRGFDIIDDSNETDSIEITSPSSSLVDEPVRISLNSYYETPYSLLDTISPSYRNSFSNELAQRLMKLCK
ncbi:GSK3B-interacting protein [Dermatophagoides farinae]|uniref:Duf727 domain containing protein n=1 Tax=Dermatophagoides farinae TaxID=6954 RepID=A0A922ICL4_DERFA|nr:GSK3B-interacting protein-like [Dermatophagoides farinae]XP_046910362.1 GSK3B-interacting protein-like [Dermatophagoides farinae]XP_046910363.1 GSK3B-interacting protein-like [Dermatophagoides farinae]KAH7641959.1 duf727 domain containing protein [Dermatophagoides farinae]KAH9529051.1 hypothetical protein DERF_002960 [Dermatophagoides farinae]